MSEFYQMAELPKEKKIEVINYVTLQKEIRTSELQRKFLWGYHRAGNTMDWLHSLGIVSEFNGLIYRNVLMSNKDAQKIIEGLS
jgi:DNA segregation ATPase FtsK/SpoIIIE-like protein